MTVGTMTPGARPVEDVAQRQIALRHVHLVDHAVLAAALDAHKAQLVSGYAPARRWLYVHTARPCGRI